MVWLIALLLLNAAYIAALPSPTIFYVVNVLLHPVLAAVAVFWLARRWRRSARLVPLALAAAIGVYLLWGGATTNHYAILWVHIAFGIAGLALVMPRRNALARDGRPRRHRRHRPLAAPQARIRNPQSPPLSMNEEGAGPKSPFWPSSAHTNTGGLIPSDFFMDSKLCGECHKDIYEQWKGSMHHFASFNNPFYKASILHMQELSGTQGSKWCAGCHDHAVFFNGRFDRPIKEQFETPEAQNGLGCVSCHSIVHVGSSMGTGRFPDQYPPLHQIANSHNPWIRKLDYFITFLNPEPHRRTFMKDFMRGRTPRSIAPPATRSISTSRSTITAGSAASTNTTTGRPAASPARARASFYYPPKSATCSDCHMPLVASRDPGNRNGMIHSHRFAAANTAVAAVNNDEKQLRQTEAFLKSGFITVDLFAAVSGRAAKASPE